VFANRNATRLKALWFDGNGYCLLYKRLHRAVFEKKNTSFSRSGGGQRLATVRKRYCNQSLSRKRGSRSLQGRAEILKALGL
jgi:hypothetical protein